jgi:hypothetical protein
VIKLPQAGDADPGLWLRRRRREVALWNEHTSTFVSLLDAKYTLGIRSANNKDNDFSTENEAR